MWKGYNRGRWVVVLFFRCLMNALFDTYCYSGLSEVDFFSSTLATIIRALRRLLSEISPQTKKTLFVGIICAFLYLKPINLVKADELTR